MKPLSTYVTLAMRGAALIILCTVLGVVLGLGAAFARPATETSRALTTLSSADIELPVEAVYSVNQMIRVTMPGYVAYARDASVIQAAATAVGTDPGVIDSGLAVVRQPDASVIEWTLTVPKGTDAKAALAAGLTQFNQVVAQAAPKSDKGLSLVKVVTNRDAGDVSIGAVSPILAGLAGAFVGFAAGLAVVIARGARANIVTSRDSIEMGLDTPVVAEMGSDEESRDRAWRYAAAAIARSREPQNVLVLGGRAEPGAADLERLRSAIAQLTPALSPTITGGVLKDSLEAAQLAASSDGIILPLVMGVDSTSELDAQVNGLHHVCRGAVVAILDTSPATRAAISRSAARTRAEARAR